MESSLHGLPRAASGPRAICELPGESSGRVEGVQEPLRLPKCSFQWTRTSFLLLQLLLVASAPPEPAPPQTVGLAVLLQQSCTLDTFLNLSLSPSAAE